MKHKLLICSLAVFFTVISSAYSQKNWPKEISHPNGALITMYEPQPETIEGNEVTGRAAISIKETADAEPVFGAILFSAKLDDNKSGKADIRSMTVTRAKFSGIEDQQEVDEISALIEKEAPRLNWGLTRDDITASVEREKGRSTLSKFNNAAPKIIYANKPTTLVVIDGEPKIIYDSELKANKVANSPNLIFQEGKHWNMYVGGNWYRSSSITGGWKSYTALSAKTRSVHDAIKEQEKENNNGVLPETSPRVTDIIVATEPTELLQTEGAPEYKQVAGTSLLYVSNSPNEIFKEINGQQTYILIAGRWYQAPNLKGPWKFVSADQLPADFAKIPKGSDKEDVLPSVAGTDAAEEARMDAMIPQTAKVDKNTATIDVRYDGAPIFNHIEGTSLQLAENANLTVMLDRHGNYFALDNGIWFISDRPDGPWAVANDRPRDVEYIPASSPAYHTKYVYVYDVTPDYVYMGYTPGYLGSYVYGPTVVYGTGYHYRPWFRSVYYARPITWGFGFMYDPWYGWNINWGYNYGFLHIGFDYAYSGYGYGYRYGGGWFGPRRYCPPYRSPYWGGSYYGNSRRDYYYDGGYDSRVATDQTRGTRRTTGWTRNYNMYNNQQGVTATTDRTARLYRPATGDRTQRPIVNRYNNVQGTARERRDINNDNYRRIERQNGERPLNPARGNNRQQPAVVGERGQDDIRNEQPVSRPSYGRPSERTAPRLQARESAVERPSVGEHRSSPVQRPQINERPTAERPEVDNRSPERIQRPEAPSRPSTPVQRPSFDNRGSAPVQRAEAPRSEPSYAPRPSAAPSRPSISTRPSAPSGGSPGVNNGERGRRPDRR